MEPSVPKPIRKAVFPVAGLGTRFLPATKAVPKEMLTIVDKPVIQYAVDEALAAGIETLIFVTGRNKGVIEDHFDMAYELEATLKARSKEAAMKILEAQLPPAGSSLFTRQQAPLGLGHAVWCAREIVGDDPFAVLLPDMLMSGNRGALKQMVDVYNQHGGNIVSLSECDPSEAHNYGIVSKGEDFGSHFEVTGMIEKPAAGTAPSNYYINGRYILDSKIMELLSNQEAGAGGEIQLTDSMLTLMSDQKMFGTPFAGETYDCGSKLGFLTANMALGLKDAELGSELGALMRKMLG
ncbi:MAG: UTP--glucose-1-phosphate uridylyltransferase GalU [Pseudomonadota bacterium]